MLCKAVRQEKKVTPIAEASLLASLLTLTSNGDNLHDVATSDPATRAADPTEIGLHARAFRHMTIFGKGQYYEYLASVMGCIQYDFWVASNQYRRRGESKFTT